MITKFINREQSQTEQDLETILNNCPMLETERLKRIIQGKMIGNDRLCISNKFIETKFALKVLYENLGIYTSELKNTQKLLQNYLLNDSDIIKNNEYITLLENGINIIHVSLLNLGKVLIDGYIPLLDLYFSEKEILQLLSGNYSDFKKLKDIDNPNNNQSTNKSITLNLIINHIEYRWKKGRRKDFLDCPNSEMPLFNCVSKYIIKHIESNPKLKQESDIYFNDLFGDTMVYATFDEDDNIIDVEKVFQLIKIQDLIKNFEGKFINDLKKSQIIDMTKTYKVKKEEDGSYSILGKNKEIISTIYKKK